MDNQRSILGRIRYFCFLAKSTEIKLPVRFDYFFLKTRKLLFWLLIDLPGFRAIWVKIFPHPKSVTDKEDYTPPATIGIWLISLYFAALGLSASRYEQIITRAENNHNTLLVELASGVPINVDRLRYVGGMEIPSKPEIGFNFSILNSFFQSRPYSLDAFGVDVDKFSRMIIQQWRRNLEYADLHGADLSYLPLAGANFQHADLQHANLQHSILDEADFRYALLAFANFENSRIDAANFENSKLHYTNFKSSSLRLAIFSHTQLWPTINFENADLYGADLRLSHSKNTFPIYVAVCRAETAFMAKMKPSDQEIIEKECPEIILPLTAPKQRSWPANLPRLNPM